MADGIGKKGMGEGVGSAGPKDGMLGAMGPRDGTSVSTGPRDGSVVSSGARDGTSGASVVKDGNNPAPAKMDIASATPKVSDKVASANKVAPNVMAPMRDNNAQRANRKVQDVGPKVGPSNPDGAYQQNGKGYSVGGNKMKVSSDGKKIGDSPFFRMDTNKNRFGR